MVSRSFLLIVKGICDKKEIMVRIREERRDEKKRLDHLKQDQTMLVIKRFSERKKREKDEVGGASLRYEMGEKKLNEVDSFLKEWNWMVVKEIEDGLLEEIGKFGWWFEQDIDGEDEDDNENKLVMVNEEGWMS
ncbi:hypothetical protein Tco_0861105 [Tanacetum coccineum]|uniref:Uncharacterized protein n=1 Tax=Tanacetum coccineum TaxID=301880 RepID=A0ABQ5BHP3_9ASTR